jgi:acetylornithine deacetylase
VTCILISNEENSSNPETLGVGVDGLMATGKMDHIKSGPVVWLDCADMHPCIGTMSSIEWSLKASPHTRRCRRTPPRHRVLPSAN